MHLVLIVACCILFESIRHHPARRRSFPKFFPEVTETFEEDTTLPSELILRTHRKTGGGWYPFPQLSERVRVIPDIGPLKNWTSYHGPQVGTAAMYNVPTFDALISCDDRGDPTPYRVASSGEAIDLLTQELLIKGGSGHLDVLWLIDRSESMQDDRVQIERTLASALMELELTTLGLRTTHSAAEFGAGFRQLAKRSPSVDGLADAWRAITDDGSGVERVVPAIEQMLKTVIDEQDQSEASRANP